MLHSTHYLQEAHTQKMQDLEQRLAQQHEREFEERLALHINALVVQHKEELLEMRRVHDDQISSLRRKLTKPALLMQELEHSHKTVAVSSSTCQGHCAIWYVCRFYILHHKTASTQ